jgi:hypothetical protein
MARKGGNPNLVRHQFKQTGLERLDIPLVVKLSRRQKDKVAKIPGFANKLRQWIDEIEV